MRIARPSRPEVPFKRKRSPPPQATKLLTYSLATGIVFMVLLGIVFLPRMFVDQSPVALLQLELGPGAGTTLVVNATTAVLPLSKFRAAFARNSVTIASLSAGLAGGNATLSFVDTNTTGYVDRGDYFALTAPPPGCYRFDVYQVDVDRRVGFATWGGC